MNPTKLIVVTPTATNPLEPEPIAAASIALIETVPAIVTDPAVPLPDAVPGLAVIEVKDSIDPARPDPHELLVPA